MVDQLQPTADGAVALLPAPEAVLAPVPTTVDTEVLDAGPDAGTRILLFAHLAQIALPMSALDPRTRGEVRQDLAFLRSEVDRRRLRPRVARALLDSIVEELCAALDEDTARSLAAARPLV